MVSILVETLLMALLIQAAFFGIGGGFKTDKVTDLSYGLTFIALTIYLIVLHQAYTQLEVLVSILVILWGVRLAGYLFIRILRMKRDRRFDGIRERVLKFAQFWLLQGISVWVIMLPVIVLLAKNTVTEAGILGYAGIGVSLLGLIIETVADLQKFRFKNQPENKGKWIDSGLWAYSRHPNYFGEMLVWWGIFIAIMPVFSGWEWVSVISPLTITMLLLFVTGIPPLEKRHEEKYGDKPNFREYKDHTRLLVPLP